MGGKESSCLATLTLTNQGGMVQNSVQNCPEVARAGLPRMHVAVEFGKPFSAERAHEERDDNLDPRECPA